MRFSVYTGCTHSCNIATVLSPKCNLPVTFFGLKSDNITVGVNLCYILLYYGCQI